MSRDLDRYAVVVVATGEVLEVGLNAIAANAFVSTYNRIVEDAERQVRRVPIAWKVAENQSPAQLRLRP